MMQGEYVDARIYRKGAYLGTVIVAFLSTNRRIRKLQCGAAKKPMGRGVRELCGV